MNQIINLLMVICNQYCKTGRTVAYIKEMGTPTMLPGFPPWAEGPEV